MDKSVTFCAAIYAALFICIKEKHLEDKKQEVEQLFQDKKRDQEIFESIRCKEFFLDIIDKQNIYKNCKEEFLSLFADNALSEKLLIDKLREMLNRASDEEKQQVLDICISVAFKDSVLTDEEKESLPSVSI